mmetsp:Transcript_6157/g.11316  ORF Transcript_6157/g.11316 Transcript_6157/m.11316 type:complete len:141 (-) Transcript_6157:138-560(-)
MLGRRCLGDSCLLDLRGDSLLDLRGDSLLDLRGETLLDLRGDSLLDLRGDSLLDLPGDSLFDLRGDSLVDGRGDSLLKSLLDLRPGLGDTYLGDSFFFFTCFCAMPKSIILRFRSRGDWMLITGLAKSQFSRQTSPCTRR